MPIVSAMKNADWLKTRDAPPYLEISGYAGVLAATTPRFDINLGKIRENITRVARISIPQFENLICGKMK
jgi:hypothetical protein